MRFSAEIPICPFAVTVPSNLTAFMRGFLSSILHPLSIRRGNRYSEVMSNERIQLLESTVFDSGPREDAETADAADQLLRNRGADGHSARSR